MQVGVTITDCERNILYVNPAFKRVTGYSREEAVGRSLAEVFPLHVVRRLERETSSAAVGADGSLVLLGVDQGAGWSTNIGESDGRLTLSVSGGGICYLAFGSCIPQ